jgi:hypothetical protein
MREPQMTARQKDRRACKASHFAIRVVKNVKHETHGDIKSPLLTRDRDFDPASDPHDTLEEPADD